MIDPITYFITWTTYGAWLPGDQRGWRKWKSGEQQPRPLLEAWCRDRMKEEPVLLNANQRRKVEDVCRRHAEIRGWVLHAISARSNHIHIAVTADAAPEKVRDQFKANATRVLRQQPEPITNDKVWTRGGDTEIVDGDDALEQVVLYITEAQDRMERGK
jgi:REP element-mobilizing transposase RayT